MKQKLFQTLMLLTTIGTLASCKKENVDAPPALQERAAREAAATLTRTPITAPKLMSIKNYNLPVAQFTYDAQGRVNKVVERNASTYWEYVTTTYTYGSGTIAIKRFKSNTPDWYLMDLTGTVNGNGQITSLKGGIEGNDWYVAYAFSYTNNRLTEMQYGKGSTMAVSPTDYTIKYKWNTDGNLETTTRYSDGKWVETKAYFYSSTQPDKRGVWNDIASFWTDGLFGLHNKNLCFKVSTYKLGSATPTAITQSWTLNLVQLPISCSVTDPAVSASPVPYTYNFQ